MILVTGASGTLGKEISRQLAQGKHNFRCLVRKTSKVKELEEMGANFIYGDVTDRESLKEAMKDVKSIISAHSLGMQKKGITYWDVDYQGNLNLIELLKENGGGNFVYISALGVALNSRFQLYKVKQLIEDSLKISGLNYTIFRPSGFFSDFTMSAKIVQKYHLYPVMGWGDHRIQGIHMGDIAYCAIDSLSNSKAYNQLFYIGGPEVLSFKQIAAIYSKVLGHNVRIFPIPIGFQKTVGWAVDTLTNYRYDIQGFVNAFSSGDSICNNEPLLKTFDIKLRNFEEYLREFFAKK
jgi:uncharacterized protein YbjT (DUF2867 family)